MQRQKPRTERKLRCLIIEDSVFDQKMIQRAIAGARVGADVDIADSLGSARAALATSRFSVVFCDNNLPDGNGTDFAQELAQEPGHRDTAIAIISGWPSPFMWAKARAAGLQVIDKNDQPQVKLRDIVRRRLSHLGRNADLRTGARRAV